MWQLDCFYKWFDRKNDENDSQHYLVIPYSIIPAHGPLKKIRDKKPCPIYSISALLLISRSNCQIFKL